QEPMRRKRESQRLGSGHKVCEREYRKFPRAYDFPAHSPQISDETSTKAHSTGIFSRLNGDRPSHRCLREWSWHETQVCDVSALGAEAHRLENANGDTVAFVRRSDYVSLYYVSFPRTIPLPSFEPLDRARLRAERLALAGLPLDRKLAA